MGSDFKAITNTDQVQVQEALHRLDMQTPSLVNAGWRAAQGLFKDRISEVDNRAQALSIAYDLALKAGTMSVASEELAKEKSEAMKNPEAALLEEINGFSQAR